MVSEKKKLVVVVVQATTKTRTVDWNDADDDSTKKCERYPQTPKVGGACEQNSYKLGRMKGEVLLGYVFGINTGPLSQSRITVVLFLSAQPSH
jgi:hypothetical protein